MPLEKNAPRCWDSPRLTGLLVTQVGAAEPGNSYLVQNLVSDGAFRRRIPDALLINAWGLAASPTESVVGRGQRDQRLHAVQRDGRGKSPHRAGRWSPDRHGVLRRRGLCRQERNVVGSSAIPVCGRGRHDFRVECPPCNRHRPLTLSSWSRMRRRRRTTRSTKAWPWRPRRPGIFSTPRTFTTIMSTSSTVAFIP